MVHGVATVWLGVRNIVGAPHIAFILVVCSTTYIPKYDSVLPTSPFSLEFFMRGIGSDSGDPLTHISPILSRKRQYIN